MKAGLCVQLSMLERAMNGHFEGNLLLITVPDEEVNSRGMIEAVPVLKEMEKKHDITLTACLNAEPMFEKFPGDQQQYFYTGSIGKVLAGFFCKGIETHVGEPFSGLNANLMVSEINRLLELNADYCEKVDGEVTPPPVNLMQKDLKEAYSVQTPHTAVTLFNVLSMRRSASELHQMLLKTAKQAAEEIMSNVRKKTQSFQQFEPFQPIERAVTVLTFDELVARAKKRAGISETDRALNYAFANRGSLEIGIFRRKLFLRLLRFVKRMPRLLFFFIVRRFIRPFRQRTIN